MANELGITGEKAQALFLRLDEQQFVEWVFVFKRMRKLGRSMMSRQRQELPIEPRSKRQHGCGIDQPLPLSGDVETVPLEAQLPHNYSRKYKRRVDLCYPSALGL